MNIMNEKQADKKQMNIFVDTCTVNRITDLEVSRAEDSKWEEDCKYLKRLSSEPQASGIMKFIYNPSVISEVEATKDTQRRDTLLSTLKRLGFTEFNMTIFPFHFPAQLLSEEQKAEIERLCQKYPALEKDKKILADSAFNETIDVLLTTDRDLSKVRQLGKIKVMLPKELWDFYRGK
jgi:hypothetical protein